MLFLNRKLKKSYAKSVFPDTKDCHTAWYLLRGETLCIRQLVSSTMRMSLTMHEDRFHLACPNALDSVLPSPIIYRVLYSSFWNNNDKALLSALQVPFLTYQFQTSLADESGLD